MGTWIDDGKPGTRWLENEREVKRFVRSLQSHPDHPEWWIVTIGSMSRAARIELVNQLVAPGYSIRRFRWQDKRALARSSKATRKAIDAEVREVFGVALMLPWVLVVSTLSMLGRLVGRGPRMYLLHAPSTPPPMNPPSGGVREPLTPLPTSGPSALMAEDPALGH